METTLIMQTAFLDSWIPILLTLDSNDDLTTIF
jgi:hypothetical protein